MTINMIYGLREKVFYRFLLHFLFWVLMFFLFIYLKSPLLGLPFEKAAVVVIKDVFVIGAIFYFISYYVFPKLVLKQRFIAFFCALVAIYYFYAIMLFLDFTFIPRFIDIPGKGYQMYSSRITSAGLLGILRFSHAAEIVMDLSYMLSPALIIKLVVKLFDLGTQAMKLQLDNLNLEMAFLKAQINPHFLFNTLNNVYSLALHKSDLAPDVILKLSDLMRYTLYESNTPQIALSEEMIFFKNYIELEKIRHSASKVAIALDIQGDYKHLAIAPLIIFPFIENAFKHGINSTLAKSWVNISFIIHDDTMLDVLISNSKPAMKVPITKVGGIGIANTKKRLNLLYANKYKLNVTETDTTFQVDLSIKLTKIVAKSAEYAIS